MADRIIAQYKSLSEQVHEQFPNAKIPKRINELIDIRIEPEVSEGIRGLIFFRPLLHAFD